MSKMERFFYHVGLATCATIILLAAGSLTGHVKLHVLSDEQQQRLHEKP